MTETVKAKKHPLLKAAERHRKSNVRIAKYLGDDSCSWALFLHDRPVYTGMTKDEAEWRRKEYIKKGKL